MSYYNRAGEPIDMMTWAQSSDLAQKAVKQEYVGGWFVSTVWLGLDHGLGDGPPLIFETMVFPPGEDGPEGHSWFEEYCERYPAEEAALAGHERALAWLRDKLAGGAS